MMNEEGNLRKRDRKQYMAINKKTIQKAIGAFIPQHIPNRMVMSVMGLLTIFKTSKRQVAQNREHNYELLVEKENSKETGQFFIPGEYIENQAQWEKYALAKNILWPTEVVRFLPHIMRW